MEIITSVLIMFEKHDQHIAISRHPYVLFHYFVQASEPHSKAFPNYPQFGLKLTKLITILQIYEVHFQNQSQSYRSSLYPRAGFQKLHTN